MRPIGKIRYITIHAADTYPHMDIGAREIREWHVEGRGWSDIGYHYVIRRDGRMEHGRKPRLQGAHVGGFNARNIGICMVGGKSNATGRCEDNFTTEQWKTLFELAKFLHAAYPEAVFMGHNGFPGHEARGCPCFDWKRWRKEFFRRLQEPQIALPSHWYDEVDLE